MINKVKKRNAWKKGWTWKGVGRREWCVRCRGILPQSTLFITVPHSSRVTYSAHHLHDITHELLIIKLYSIRVTSSKGDIGLQVSLEARPWISILQWYTVVKFKGQRKNLFLFILSFITFLIYLSPQEKNNSCWESSAPHSTCVYIKSVVGLSIPTWMHKERHFVIISIVFIILELDQN